jgi:hypothetical protein
LYPVRCECLDLDILSEQMHAIARAEPLIVNGQPRDYDREVMIAAWRRSQSPQPVAEPCCDKPRRSIVSAARGAIGLAKATAGINAADRDTIEQRYATCQACPHNDCGQCQRCGCWIAPKIRIRSENCPLGTW